MGRKILFITADQMRYDALGCNGGRVARTPNVDALATAGIRYERAHGQSVVCMPARSSMITGQHVSTHGVWMNGVPLPADAPSVARHLQEQAGYRTALIGKAHFEPHLDPNREFYENQMVPRGEHGPHRGFDYMELATHSAHGLHYGQWLRAEHPGSHAGFYENLQSDLRMNDAVGGDTGAIQVCHNPIAREHYHTDWVADRTIAYLGSLEPDDDFFVWMSFPDPHHPWDPPASERGRVQWRELDAPAGYPGSREACERILASKPRQYLDYFTGRNVSNMEAPARFAPASLGVDQLREIEALVHIENELIDDACGRVLGHIAERGWAEDTDVLFTTDHGELQGDLGLLFKGPYHVDALMRLPLVWRPAPRVAQAPAVVRAPVGQIDLAPTFCEIADVPAPDWMEGRALPRDSAEAQTQGRRRTFTQWDSDFGGDRMHLRTIYRDGWVCTRYLPGTVHDGSEGELYALGDDPLQHRNLWDEPAHRATRDALVEELQQHGPTEPTTRRPPVANV